MPMKKSLVSAVLTVALLVAVPAGAMLLWGGSAGVAQAVPIGQLVFDYNTTQTNTLLAAHNQSADQRIATKTQVRGSEQGTINPSTPVYKRF